MNHILGANGFRSSALQEESLGLISVLKTLQLRFNLDFLVIVAQREDGPQCRYSSLLGNTCKYVIQGIFDEHDLKEWPTDFWMGSTNNTYCAIQPIPEDSYIVMGASHENAESDIHRLRDALTGLTAQYLNNQDFGSIGDVFGDFDHLFHTTTEHSMNAVSISETSGRLIYANKLAMEWLGLEAKDIGRIFVRDFEKRFQGDSQAWDSHVAELREMGSQHLQGVWWNKAGEYYIDVSVTVRAVQLGGQTYIVAETMDITERNLVQIRLQEELDLQELMLNLSSGFINADLNQVSDLIQLSLQQIGEFFQTDRTYIFDYDYVAQTTSNTYEWCAEGISPEIENLQQVPMEMVPQWLEKHAKGETMLIEDVMGLGDDDSELREILASQDIKSLIALPMMRDGVPIGFVGLDSVKVKRKYSEREVRILELFSQMLVNAAIRMENQKEMEVQDIRYRTLIENINLGLMEIDGDYTITYVNNTLLDNFGYQKEEVLGNSVVDFVDNNQNILETAEEKIRLLASGEHLSLEFPSFTKSGERRYLLVSVARQEDMHGFLKGYMLAFVDLTKQKQLEFDLMQAIVEIEKASEGKERFFANISHEMRTPLNVITGVIAELNKEESDENFQLLENARRASNHLLNLVNNVLDMAMINAGKITLSQVDFDLHKVISDTLAIVQGSMEPNKPVELFKDIDNLVPQYVSGDKYKVQQVLMNLIGNGVKFTKEGWVKVNVSLTAEQADKVTLRFSISDTGIGMRKAFMERMFDEFERDFRTNDLTQGTGLGLAISNELVRIMGGQLQVSSTFGRGTHIHFELTFAKASVRATEEKVVYDSSLLRDKKIVLAEDNPMNQVLAKRQLSYYGAELKIANNGKEALELMQTYSPDLILMDIQMPEMDGVECTKRIREEYTGSRIPILAITANAFKNKLDEYLAQGMDDYIIKPYTESLLIEKVAQLLGLSLTSGQNRSAGPHQCTEGLANQVYNNLRAISGTDQEFFQQLLDTFMELGKATLQEMRAAMAEGDLYKVSRLAHRVKPSLKQLELYEIQNKVLQLEQMELTLEQKQTIFEEVNQTLGMLLQKLERMMNEIS